MITKIKRGKLHIAGKKIPLQFILGWGRYGVDKKKPCFLIIGENRNDRQELPITERQLNKYIKVIRKYNKGGK